MNERFQLMLQWLESLPSLANKTWSEPVAASSDASFRRYFRIHINEHAAEAENGEGSAFGAASYVIMDAPVEHEDCRPFIKVADELYAMGLQVPRVIEQNLQQGFLLLADLGNTTYLSTLKQASQQEVDGLYRDALDALVTMQLKGKDQSQKLPAYDSKLLNMEMSLFTDWLVNKHLELTLSNSEIADWQAVTQLLTTAALQQPKTYVHRDYHSRNLMVLAQNNPGILDFQDAVRGPLTYDAVSLLRDCYIAWPAEQVLEWQRYYFLELCQQRLALENEWSAFKKAMDLMGVQRHLKASGIFCRLFHRDAKDGYLADIPLTLQYITQVGRQYKELNSLVQLTEERVLPAVLQE